MTAVTSTSTNSHSLKHDLLNEEEDAPVDGRVLTVDNAQSMYVIFDYATINTQPLTFRSFYCTLCARTAPHHTTTSRTSKAHQSSAGSDDRAHSELLRLRGACILSAPRSKRVMVFGGCPPRPAARLSDYCRDSAGNLSRTCWLLSFQK